MRYLAIVGLLALLAGPAMAADADVPVQITVLPYCAIAEAPGSLVMTASDVYHTGVAVSEGVHQATTTFKMQGNKAYTAVMTAQFTSNSAGDVPGGTELTYPTAYIGGVNTDLTKGIGFGPAFSLNNGGTSTGWSGTALKDTLTLNAGVTEGTLKINTYIDSGRTGIPGADPINPGQLAAPGEYTCNLYLTLSIAP